MPKNRHTQITIWHKIFLMLAGLIFALIMAELGLRLNAVIFSYLQEGKNRRSIQQKGNYKIMCLGESTTARQWPPLLEEILNQKNIGVKFSVIDKGFFSATTEAILLRLEDNLAIYKPDMVIVMAGINDRYVRYYNDIPEVETKLFQHCRLYRFIRLAYMHILNKAQGKSMRSLRKKGLNLDRDSVLVTTGSMEREGGFSAADPMDTAIKVDDPIDVMLVKTGLHYRNLREFSEAEKSFKEAIALNPRNYRAYIELGLVYRWQGKFLKVEKVIKKAIDVDPKNDRAYSELAWVYRRSGRYAEAERILNKVIRLNPRSERAYFDLAWLYRRSGRFAEAERALKKSIELKPHTVNAYIELAWLKRRENEFLQAEEILLKAAELNPGDDLVNGALESLYIDMDRAGYSRQHNRKSKQPETYYNSLTFDNYHKLKDILGKKGIQLVCVQYPMRSIEPLKRILQGQEGGIIFVDNESTFKDAVRREGYGAYFVDMFGGDFGHCTEKGNRLLAGHIASIIIKDKFRK